MIQKNRVYSFFERFFQQIWKQIHTPQVKLKWNKDFPVVEFLSSWKLQRKFRAPSFRKFHQGRPPELSLVDRGRWSFYRP